MKITRRKFIATALLAGAGVGYMRYFEPDMFEVTEKSIRINLFSHSFRILHLSDFHFSNSVSLKSIEKAINLSIEQKPDVAFLTGDFITWKFQDESHYRNILQKLTSVIPLLDYRPFLPVKDKSFPEGILSWENRHIHVTRGIGNLHGLRFNCRPEISLLNVKASI